jgi:acetyltransferase-like isoleucine patch superfamily enzyme
LSNFGKHGNPCFAFRGSTSFEIELERLPRRPEIIACHAFLRLDLKLNRTAVMLNNHLEEKSAVVSQHYERNEISFLNFVNDTWIRTLAGKEWIYRFGGVENSHGWSVEQLDEFRSLYKKVTQYYLSDVKISAFNEARAIDDVSFDSRFGWVLVADKSKAYLGKVEVSDDLPIEIGRQTYLSGHSLLRGKDALKIGAFTSIAEGLYLNTSADLHPYEYASLINFAAERRCRGDGLSMDISFGQIESLKTGISIGSDVWIGRNVRIFSGARVADGCVIAERSLVRGDTEPYGIYAGIPAKLKKFRFSGKVIASLLDMKWWNWSNECLLRNKRLFSTNLASFDGDPADLLVS